VACVRGKEGGWKGFLEGPRVFHSDWGFDPREMGREWGSRVLVVIGDEDGLGFGMGRWLEKSYEGARLKVVRGGHVAALWFQNEIWEEMLKKAAP
jgi:pimeloyl-ACP methyl ester carboxylesterase